MYVYLNSTIIQTEMCIFAFNLQNPPVGSFTAASLLGLALLILHLNRLSSSTQRMLTSTMHMGADFVSLIGAPCFWIAELCSAIP